MLAPAYSALVAYAAFEFVLQRALAAGAPPRPRWVRAVCEFLLGLILLAAFVLLGTACLLAAGPKALG